MKPFPLLALILGFSLLTSLPSVASLGPVPFRGPPPEKDEIEEVLFRPTCIANEIDIGRDRLLNFFEKGVFSDVHPPLDSKPERDSEDGIRFYGSGCFATKQGKVFRFHPCSSRILEISGSAGPGFLALP